jgi:2-polyprenyl-6-methoxyphenol hydroxylase-like FAD-dependent oxidoreductase
MAERGDVLVSGAGIAGPTLAYWLHRSGFRTTVVERAPSVRRGWGGHAVDLFGPAVEITERMGLLPQVQEARTRTGLMSLVRPGKPAVDVDLARIATAVSDRHVEIMRGELAAILHEATRDDVEYVFGDGIRGLAQHDDGVEVTFHHGGPRRFDLVVGADGLHSAVRRLAFGDESRFRRYIGGYLAVHTVPDHLRRPGRMLVHLAPGRMAATYPVRQTGQARAAFLFRRARELDDDRDPAAQRQLLRQVYGGDGGEVPRLLAGLDRADDFYFDSISQIVMDRWTDGRVALVGDAGYSPGPAVGGGTSVAMIGAYVLADALDRCGVGHGKALDHYTRAMREVVLRSRDLGPAMMRTLIPATAWQVSLTVRATQLFARLPAAARRRLLARRGGPAAVLESVALPARR